MKSYAAPSVPTSTPLLIDQALSAPQAQPPGVPYFFQIEINYLEPERKKWTGLVFSTRAERMKGLRKMVELFLGMIRKVKKKKGPLSGYLTG